MESNQTEAKDNKSNAEEEEVDDYMSNDFLNQIPDKRPGLVFSHTQARKNELEKKHHATCRESKARNLQMSSKHLEKVNREEALKTSVLTENSKGLNLMKKMGYKTGETLGRQGKSEETISKASIEPISVEIKLDRGGLGQAEEKKRKHEDIVRMREDLLEKRVESVKQTAESYLESKRSRFLIRKLIHNLHKCQKVCYQLDSTQQELKEPSTKWFWPINIRRALKDPTVNEERSIKCLKTDDEPETEPDTEADSIESSMTSQDYYEKIINTGVDSRRRIDVQQAYKERLRVFIEEEEDEKQTKIESNDAVNESNDENDDIYIAKFSTKVREEKEASDQSDNDENNEENYTEEVLREKIDLIWNYLKQRYFYCVWCAYKYDNADDFLANCPGSTEDDHE